MNVTSLDLCKELYKLSGWQCRTPVIDGYPSKIVGFRYDLGYLLRKLPPLVHVYVDRQGHWFAKLMGSGLKVIEWKYADTPEDAACKLAQELFKQNILTKETN